MACLLKCQLEEREGERERKRETETETESLFDYVPDERTYFKNRNNLVMTVPLRGEGERQTGRHTDKQREIAVLEIRRGNWDNLRTNKYMSL